MANKVLKRMNRKSNGESIRKLIIKLRKEIPDVIIRTTVMVGFPGETQEDFEELYEFLKEAKFDDIVTEVDGAVLFDDDMAESIINFIELHKTKVDTLLVHCYAGQSTFFASLIYSSRSSL